MKGKRSPRAARWSPFRFAWRSALGHRRGQTLALVAVSALITACTAFAPVYDRAMQHALVDTLLANASATEKSVVLVSESDELSSGATEPRSPGKLEEFIPAAVTDGLEPVVLGRTASVTPIDFDIPPTGPLVWRGGACEHLTLLSGSCPKAPGDILVSEADVDNFDLSPGSVLKVGVAADETYPPVRLEVVGTYAPRDELWWQGQQLVGLSGVFGTLDPTAAHDAWVTTEETFVDAPPMLGESSQAGALVRTSLGGVDEVLALGAAVQEMGVEASGRGSDIEVHTGLGDLTGEVRTQVLQGDRTVPLLMAPVAVLALFVLWLVLAAATEQRRGQVAVARLRGRGPRGAVDLLLIELIPVLLAGVVPGAVLALLGGAVARRLLPGAAPFEVGPEFAIAVLLAVVVVVLTTVAAAVRVAREPMDSLMRRGRVKSMRWTLGALDAFLIAAVGTGVLAFVTGSLKGPLALAGPALLALFAGLLLGHLAAPTASAWGRRLLRRGRLATGVTLLEMGRRRETRTVIAVLTVASALAVFAVDALVVGERNRTNASQHDAGAPVVLSVAGRNLDGVRAALSAADPTGHQATPVMISRTTLAVEPEGFRRVALFPRGAPTDAQWEAIAPPDTPPVDLTGTRISVTATPDSEFTTTDALGDTTDAELRAVVTTSSGDRRSVYIGTLPPPGTTATLVGKVSECADGCVLAAVQFVASFGVEVEGGLELADLQVDGRATAWGGSAEDWNTTEGEQILIFPNPATSGDVLDLLLALRGDFPAELTPAWVPPVIPALLPTDRKDELEPVVSGPDGAERAARSEGRILLVPTMPTRSAIVDLDAISRGSEFTNNAHVEVWLDGDPELEAAVTASLRERGIPVTDVRRLPDVRQGYDESVATWSLALGAVLAPAVILIALLVLLVLAVTGWRERARDLAVLRLNGASRGTTGRVAVWAQLPSVVLGIVAGVSAGVLGAAVAMPDVPFFARQPTVPVVDPSTAWTAVLAVAAACCVLLPAAAALGGRAVARRAHLERAKEAA
ncbi:ABC transporter permease [Nocardioides sp.]|uniref:ABC transporter permease n=1 Tax=Nocardioides sp. TaxID=35761 RepID=UPI002D167272|nr:FtsX-like permease family protein [Nocardioides sp.]HXH78944.1 FtsX-like permease family protein [Nocardioides sp.]